MCIYIYVHIAIAAIYVGALENLTRFVFVYTMLEIYCKTSTFPNHQYTTKPYWGL